MSQSTDISILDGVKRNIGDDNEEIFSEKEYMSFIHEHVHRTETSTNIQRIEGTDYFTLDTSPIYAFSIDSPESGEDYLLDEMSGTIENTSSGDNRDKFKVTYHEIDFNLVMCDILQAIATSESKLSVTQSVAGYSIDQKELERRLIDQSIVWKNK